MVISIVFPNIEVIKPRVHNKCIYYELLIEGREYPASHRSHYVIGVINKLLDKLVCSLSNNILGISLKAQPDFNKLL